MSKEMQPKNVIVYKCDTDCTPDDRKKKVKVRSDIYLLADGTDVNLEFAVSPFDPPVTSVPIAANTFVKLTFGSTDGKYVYKLTCTGCATARNLEDPSMIVDL